MHHILGAIYYNIIPKKAEKGITITCFCLGTNCTQTKGGIIVTICQMILMK